MGSDILATGFCVRSVFGGSSSPVEGWRLSRETSLKGIYASSEASSSSRLTFMLFC